MILVLSNAVTKDGFQVSIYATDRPLKRRWSPGGAMLVGVALHGELIHVIPCGWKLLKVLNLPDILRIVGLVPGSILSRVQSK